MEPNEIQLGMAAAVEEVLETMCFTSVLASGEGPAPVPEENAAAANPVAPPCTAELRFEGNPSGGCRVSVSRKLARIVGAGFLGLDETEVSDSQTEEVVCELANMIRGSLLSRLESDATFRIAHPELTAVERVPAFEGAAASRWFDLGDGILTVSLELQPAV